MSEENTDRFGFTVVFNKEVILTEAKRLRKFVHSELEYEAKIDSLGMYYKTEIKDQEYEKYDPIKEVNNATLCLHCRHRPVCKIKEETKIFENTWRDHVYGLSRLLSEMAKSCKHYWRKEK